MKQEKKQRYLMKLLYEWLKGIGYKFDKDGTGWLGVWGT